MGEGKCSPGPWKVIENSWQYTTIYDAHDREICRLDLERFEDLNEETQGKYEAIQRADAAAIVRACDHDAALRRAKAEGLRLAIETLEDAIDYSGGCVGTENDPKVVAVNVFIEDAAKHLLARAAQIEEGE